VGSSAQKKREWDIEGVAQSPSTSSLSPRADYDTHPLELPYVIIRNIEEKLREGTGGGKKRET
jgi:hypothetical protein